MMEVVDRFLFTLFILSASVLSSCLFLSGRQVRLMSAAINIRAGQEGYIPRSRDDAERGHEKSAASHDSSLRLKSAKAVEQLSSSSSSLFSSSDSMISKPFSCDLFPMCTLRFATAAEAAAHMDSAHSAPIKGGSSKQLIFKRG